jgi:hypothetical protein
MDFNLNRFVDCEIINGAYKEIVEYGIKYRLFSTFSEEDMNWHIDGIRRKIHVLRNSGDWQIQFDDEIPNSLTELKNFIIEAEQFHRVIKGRGDLLIAIEEGDFFE